MDSYLFLCTLGPVQDFIAAARRSRDLWAGSKLLSELSRTAAQALLGLHAELIFPALDPGSPQFSDETYDVVNRILAKVQGENPNDIGLLVHEAVRAKLRELVEPIFTQKIKWPADQQDLYQKDAFAQVDALIEFFWAAVPFRDGDDYQGARDKLEAALAARKNTRNFAQPSWARSVPKSSIDGLRESLIPEEAFPSRKDDDPKKREKIAHLFAAYRAGKAERLSGVDLLKRYYNPRGPESHNHADIPSTAHFAALPFLERHKETYTTGLHEYLRELKRCYAAQAFVNRFDSQKLDPRFASNKLLDNYDASILFESRLREDLDGNPLDGARKALQCYLKEAFRAQAPGPYYAILHADGDHMGKAIEDLAKYGIKRHRDFSKQLDAFAGEVRGIVEETHQGALIYSGGDDVLAFLPLHTVLRCAKELADLFRDKLGGFQLEKAPTLSVGIAICHYLEPLSDALNLVRGAERAAKAAGRNALAITLSKRGGGDRTICGSWVSPFYQRLQEMITSYQHDDVPDSAAYDLHDLWERMGAVLPAAALCAEAIRIIKRKRGQHGQDGGTNDDLLNLVKSVLSTPEQAQETLSDAQQSATTNDSEASGKRLTLGQLADELIIAREFAKVLPAL